MEKIKQFFKDLGAAIEKVINDDPEPQEQPHPWRLVPEHTGLYTLEKWDPKAKKYVHVCGGLAKEAHAEQKIKHLSREIILID